MKIRSALYTLYSREISCGIHINFYENIISIQIDIFKKAWCILIIKNLEEPLPPDFV